MNLDVVKQYSERDIIKFINENSDYGGNITEFVTVYLHDLQLEDPFSNYSYTLLQLAFYEFLCEKQIKEVMFRDTIGLSLVNAEGLTIIYLDNNDDLRREVIDRNMCKFFVQKGTAFMLYHDNVKEWHDANFGLMCSGNTLTLHQITPNGVIAINSLAESKINLVVKNGTYNIVETE